MNCNYKDKSMFTALALGGTDKIEREQLMEHIKSCSVCEEEFRSVRRFLRVVEAGKNEIFGKSDEICPDKFSIVRMVEQPESMNRKQKEALERHIEKCDECNKIVDSLRKMNDRIEQFSESKLDSRPISVELDSKIKSICFGLPKEDI